MQPKQLIALLTLTASLMGCQAQAERIASAPGGHLANISIYDRNEGRTLPVYWHKGRAYIVGKPGNEYQISISNRSGQDVLAIVSVDGINVLSGKTATSGQDGYVFDAGMEYPIQGWRKSLDKTAAFYFTSLGDSYAARTGRPANVGVIGVALFRRKAPPPPPVVIYEPREDRSATAETMAPPAPAAGQAAPGRDSAKLGTGHGRIETSHVTEVEFERATSRPEEVITVYYDSYANLLARGIIRGQRPASGPQAFPADNGFVPDPPAR